MNNRKFKIIIIHFMLFSTFLTVIASHSQSNKEFDPVKNPDTYTVALSNLDFDSLDPATNYGSLGTSLNQMICESLYDYNGNSVIDLIPALAEESPIWSSDGLHLNITLKSNILFHDGTHFNAWIYKYSIDRVMMISDPNGRSFTLTPLRGGNIVNSYTDLNISEAKTYLNAGAIKIINDYAIQINLQYPYVPIVSVLTSQVGCAVSPKAIIDNIPKTFIADETDNETGMISLDTWFPELSGNYTKLGLNENYLAGVSGVIPSGVVKDGSPAQHTWFENQQVGTGPWILKSKTSSVIELNRNPDWWNANAFHEKAPTKIILKAVVDANTRALELTNGDSDSAEISIDLFNQFNNPDGSTKKDTVKSYLYDTIDVDFFGFNLRNGSELGEGYIDKYPTSSSVWDNNSSLFKAGFSAYKHLNKSADVSNPFTVLKFRQAFALAFDYNAYIQIVLNGFGTRLEGLIPKGLIGHQDDLIEKGFIPVFDLDGSKALFQELGWRGSITLLYNTASSARKALTSILKNSIEGMNVGINIIVAEMLWSTFLQQYFRIPIFLFGWSPDFADPDDYVRSFIHSEKGYYSNRINYINPAIDSMLEAAVSEINPIKRSTIYGELEKYIAEEHIFLYNAQLQEISNIWYQWNDFEESGSQNPMRNFNQIHFMDKVSQPKISYDYCSCDSLPSSKVLNSGSNNFSLIFSYQMISDFLFIFGASSVSFLTVFFLSKIYLDKFRFHEKSLRKINEKNSIQYSKNGKIPYSMQKIEELLNEFQKK
jgi:peptide/nickel transport system substrate-binding protein